MKGERERGIRDWGNWEKCRKLRQRGAEGIGSGWIQDSGRGE